MKSIYLFINISTSLFFWKVDTAESGSGSHSSNLSLDEPAYSARGEEPAYTPRPRVGQEPIYNRGVDET